MDSLIELIRESVIVQGLTTLALVITFCILVVIQAPIPPLFGDILALVLGFYFGAKVQYLVHKSKS